MKSIKYIFIASIITVIFMSAAAIACHPTLTPTPHPTLMPTPTFTPTPRPSTSPPPTIVPTATPTPTPTPTATSSPEPTITATPTPTPTATPIPVETIRPAYTGVMIPDFKSYIFINGTLTYEIRGLPNDISISQFNYTIGTWSTTPPYKPIIFV